MEIIEHGFYTTENTVLFVRNIDKDFIHVISMGDDVNSNSSAISRIRSIPHYVNTFHLPHDYFKSIINGYIGKCDEFR